MSVNSPSLDASNAPSRRGFLLAVAAFAGLAACGHRSVVAPPPPLAAGETPQLQALVIKYAQIYDLPVSLFDRVIQRESGYNPAARNGPYYGLMQILPATARSMGYEGPPSGLLDAETNLKYAGKYLRGAWIVSGYDEDRAVYWYAHGYYYEARRLGLLQATGLAA